MKSTVLLVTANLELGQLISNSLSETYLFDVEHCRDEESAIAFLEAHRDCGHALIETALGETRLIQLGKALRRIKSTIKLILISRGQPSEDVDQIRPWSLLRQPFILPELLAALDSVTPTIIDGEATEPAAPLQVSWLDDPDVAVKTLENLAVAPNIEGVILLRRHDVWAYTGNLSPVTVNKIKNVVLSNLNAEQEFDLLRFMRLEDRQDQHGLWAKLVLVNVILAVIYDLTTSFSEMRTQTNVLAEALARPILPQVPESRGLSLDTNILSPRASGRMSKMQALLSSSPDWRQVDLYKPLQARPGGEEALRRQEFHFSNNQDRPSATAAQHMAETGHMSAPDDGMDSPIESSGSRTANTNTPKRKISRSVVRSERQITPEAKSFNLPGIPYSCLLTPRFETHPLVGDLADLINSTVPKICIAYGWWLEFMEVTKDCLHWVAVLPPTETVSDHIQKIRQLTSEHIWEVSPEYLRENFSKDFWAPGYSILAGNQIHSAQQIQTYVLNYRGPHYRFERGANTSFDPSGETSFD